MIRNQSNTSMIGVNLQSRFDLLATQKIELERMIAQLKDRIRRMEQLCDEQRRTLRKVGFRVADEHAKLERKIISHERALREIREAVTDSDLPIETIAAIVERQFEDYGLLGELEPV